MYDLTTGTWSNGPRNPGGLEIRYAQTVPYMDTFLLIGSRETPTSVFQFDLANFDWIPRPETLIIGRDRHVVLDVTGMNLPCNV